MLTIKGKGAKNVETCVVAGTGDQNLPKESKKIPNSKWGESPSSCNIF